MRPARFLVALAAVPAAVALVSAAPRAGKVVRVERKAAGFVGVPRFCAIQPSDMFGSCTGSRAPEVGDRMIAVDRNRVLGTIRVTNVQPYADGCQQTYNWMIQSVAESGDFAMARGLVLAVADVSLDMRGGKLIDVDKTPTGHQWGTDQIFAIDNNGDNNPDIEFVQYACDDFGNAASNTATSSCHEVWVHTGRTPERLRQDRFRTCY